MTDSFSFNDLIAQAKTASFEALPIGEYTIEVTSADAVMSSNGKPMIKCKLRVIVGPHAKRTVFTQFVLSTDNPVALSIFFKHMKAFGLNDDFFLAIGSGANLAPVASALLGRQAVVKLGHREWQGELRNEVNGVMPVTAGSALPGSLPGVAAPVAMPLTSPPPVAVVDTASAMAATAMSMTAPPVAPVAPPVAVAPPIAAPQTTPVAPPVAQQAPPVAMPQPVAVTDAPVAMPTPPVAQAAPIDVAPAVIASPSEAVAPPRLPF